MAIVALKTNGPHSNPTVSNKPAMYTLLGARPLLLKLGLDVNEKGLSVGDGEGLEDEGANVMGLGKVDIVSFQPDSNECRLDEEQCILQGMCYRLLEARSMTASKDSENKCATTPRTSTFCVCWL
jgi:hypothetical protein